MVALLGIGYWSQMVNRYREATDKKAVCQITSLPEIYQDVFGEQESGTFVEIGAFDGYQWSNVQPLVSLGWSGLMVEPHPEFVSKCSRRFADNPNIQVCDYAIGCYNGPGILYLGGSGTTLEIETVISYSQIDWARINNLNPPTWKEVKVRTLDTLLSEYGICAGFDVLSLDVEGGEMAALAGFSIRTWHPKLMIIETHEMNLDRRLSFKSEAVDWFVLPAGYAKLYADEINTIYIRG